MSTAIVVIIVVAIVVYLVSRSIRKRRAASADSSRYLQSLEDIDLDVVGESHYQRALARIAGPKTEEGYCLPVQIELRREPTNPHDKNAVQCLINGELVGYINREGARALQPLLLKYEKAGYRPFVQGYITGGWSRPGGDEGHYGVKLGEPSAYRTSGDDADDIEEEDSEQPKLGLYAGKHYTEYVDLVTQLMRDGEFNAAEKLLLKLLDVVEEEAKARGWPLPRWYYERLAVLYRKQKRFADEVSVLERYVNFPQPTPIEDDHPLVQRLTKARKLLQQQEAGASD